MSKENTTAKGFCFKEFEFYYQYDPQKDNPFRGERDWVEFNKFDYPKGEVNYNPQVAVDYCNNHLKRLGSGSSRTVFRLTQRKVLKVATNEKGIFQNSQEVKTGTDERVRDFVTKVYDHCPDYTWIICEYAKQMSWSEFEEVMGFSFYSFRDQADAYHFSTVPNGHAKIARHFSKQASSRLKTKQIKKTEFNRHPSVKALKKYVKVKGCASDLGGLHNYGLTTRNGKKTVVLVDHGLDWETFKNQYPSNFKSTLRTQARLEEEILGESITVVN